MLNTTNRKLTHKPVASTTQMGAPATISGMAASCELPANTVSAMASDSTKLRPDFIMATPVISPQAAMPGATGSMSRAPWANSGCCQMRWLTGPLVACLSKPLPHLQRKSATKFCCWQALAACALQRGQLQHTVAGLHAYSDLIYMHNSAF